MIVDVVLHHARFHVYVIINFVESLLHFKSGTELSKTRQFSSLEISFICRAAGTRLTEIWGVQVHRNMVVQCV